MTQINDFIDGEKTIGGLVFRPFTMGSKAACAQMDLSMFTNPEKPLIEAEAERQVVAFTWLHVKPLPEVLRALREGRANDEAQAFGFDLEPHSVTQIISEINRISEQAKKNAVEVVEKSGTKDKDAPGNFAGQTG
jgi:hypothetical protein